MIDAERVTVRLEPTNLSTGNRSVLVINRGKVPVDLGGPFLLYGSGLELPPGDRLAFDLGDTDDLYGITEIDDCRVDVLWLGV